MKTKLFLFFVLIGSFSFAQNKQLKAVRIDEKIKMDGNLDENSWKTAPKAVDFLERNPTEGKKPQYPSEVSILYNDYAIYVGAMMYDDYPDSILKQLGERDDDLNADNFLISFDTYNQKLDAFVFGVSASGVQTDYRYSDFSFNAVWHSHVKILPNGWSVEMEIPFSALRFPNGDSLTWKIQIEREIRRTRSQLQWSMVSKDLSNVINYWGDLTGLTNIKNPIRLQFFPYLSSSFQQKGSERNFAYGGGADLKYGLSEAFTLDMTLLPDFSQVRSDNVVKNLSAFEQIFEEQRPFFQEGIDLFTRGNLFYTRRIGGTPNGFYDVYDKLGTNEEVTENPNSSKLINVSKISGRTQKGTGVGFLNALTDESFATIRDTISGNERLYRTNPVVNYNILTIDQNLRNNSSFFLTTLNTTRFNGFSDANASGGGLNLVNKKNSYSFYANFKITQVEETINGENLFKYDKLNDGINYFVQVAKIKGAVRASISSDNISSNYNPNDLGAFFLTNYRFHKASVSYNKFNPFWKLNQFKATVYYQMDQNYTTNKVLRHEVSMNSFTTIRKSFHSLFFDINSQVGDGIDLFESRVDGKIFINPGYFFVGGGVSSDYRRKFALDMNGGAGYGEKYYGPSWYKELRIAPIIRFTDKFTLRPSMYVLDHDGGVGFGGYDENGNPIYGKRDIFTLENVISAKYLFKNNLSLTFRVRHYWSNGEYKYHADLGDNGILVRNDAITTNTNFNFNAFNTDVVFAWQVAPGSFLNIVYKSALLSDQKEIAKSYFKNINSTFKDNPLNTLTMKFIYFFDVASLKRKRN